jgi:hypothetical protein
LQLPSSPISTALADLTKANVATATGSSTAAAHGNRISGPIPIFAAGSNGDVAPIGAIGGSFTGLSYPQGIVIGPSGP